MLVLSRKAGERIQIGDDTWIVVGKMKGSRVTLAIDAPKDVPIRRGELQQGSEVAPILDHQTVDANASSVA
tara:strand:+ start:3085 stop:3297 length:213 start_codon:yes stop_codon:yes gene_type:complete